MSIPPFRINATIPVSAIYGLDEDLSNKVTANPPIPPGTNIKISYDQKGLVTSGTGADLPDLSNVDGTITTSALATLRVLASPGFDTNFNYVDWTPPSGGGGGGSYSASNVGTGTGVFNTLIGNNFTFNSLSASSNKVSLSLASNTIGLDVVPSNFTGIPQSGVTNLVSDLASKLTANAPITPGTNTKITYDSDGLVLSGTQASLADLSNVNTTPASNSSGTLRVLASPGANTSFQYIDWTPPSGGGGGGSYTASNVGTGTGVFNSLVSNNFSFNSIAPNSSSVSVSLISNTIRLDVVPSNFTGIPQSGVTNLISSLASKLTANAPITPGTNIKISYDSDGLVTSGTGADLPDLSNVDGTITTSALATLRVLASPSFDTNFNYVDWTPSGGGGGGSYTASNVGTGTGVFNTLIGNNFTFNSLSASSNKVSLSLASNTIGLDVVPSNFSGIPQSGVTNLTSDLASKQPLDATLTALSNLDNSTGLIAQTGIDTFTKRTLSGTPNQVIVTNGNGVSGNPTLSLPQDIGTSSSPTFLKQSLGLGLVQDQDTIGGTLAISITPDIWQSFTAGITSTLSRVLWNFLLLPSSAYIVSLYSGEGVGGTLLYQFTGNYSANNNDIIIDFPVAQPITSGLKYTVRLEQTPVFLNVEPFYSQSNPYPSGRSNLSPTWDYDVRTFVLESTMIFDPSQPISAVIPGAVQASGPFILPQLTTSSRDALSSTVKTNGSVIFNSSKGYAEKYDSTAGTWYPLNSSTIISGISQFNTNGTSIISLGSSGTITAGAKILYTTYVWSLGIQLSASRTAGSVTVTVRKNGSATSATVTINTNTDGALVILSTPVSFVAGDVLSVQLVASSFTPSLTDCVFTCGIAN